MFIVDQDYDFNVFRHDTNIFSFGTSLGTGPSVYLTANEKYNFRGLILQSPFTSVVRIKVKVSNKMFFDMFPNIDRIQRVRCPTFIIHGKVDEVVPFEHAEVFVFIFY